MTINDGGPAFPTPYTRDSFGQVDTVAVGGMSLRDYFAAKAMQELVRAAIDVTKISKPIGQEIMNQAPKAAYEVADAMLKARKA